jgi:hypothetical protein
MNVREWIHRLVSTQPPHLVKGTSVMVFKDLVTQANSDTAAAGPALAQVATAKAALEAAKAAASGVTKTAAASAAALSTAIVHVGGIIVDTSTTPVTVYHSSDGATFVSAGAPSITDLVPVVSVPPVPTTPIVAPVAPIPPLAPVLGS